MHGDRDAFGVLAGHFADRMFGLANRILRDGDLAEDAVPGAMILAWRRLPSLRDADRFEPWLRTLVIRGCYAEARQRRTRTSQVHLLQADATGPDQTVSVADRDTLERAFRRLPVEQRAIFVLHHHDGLPLVDIASTLGVPAGTVRSRLHYATRALRAAIESDDPQPVSGGRTA